MVHFATTKKAHLVKKGRNTKVKKMLSTGVPHFMNSLHLIRWNTFLTEKSSFFIVHLVREKSELHLEEMLIKETHAIQRFFVYSIKIENRAIFVEFVVAKCCQSVPCNFKESNWMKQMITCQLISVLRPPRRWSTFFLGQVPFVWQREEFCFTKRLSVFSKTSKKFLYHTNLSANLINATGRCL